MKKIATLLVVLVVFACGDDYNPKELDTTAPEITIEGDNPLAITLPAEYMELGAIALDNTDGDISDRIEITTTADFLVPGSYEVTYSVSDVAGNSTSSTRDVIILEEPEEPDTTAPEITILGDNPLTITLPSEYTELGATALDDIDGDISDQIEITSTVNVLVPGSYQVTYNVSDAAGNSISSTREVIILEEPVEPDTTVPVITIIGDNPLTIKQYSEYTDLGATALDDTDGDISNGIVITSTVNVDILGSYVVSYSVSDTAGNSTSVTREVIVEEDSLLDGLVGKFDLDGNGNDTSGFNNHGTIVKRTGDVTAATNRHGMANSAMSFSYSVEENDGGYIDVGDVDALKLTSSISISVWVKASGNQVEWDDIVSKWKAPGYYLGLTLEGYLRWNIGGQIIETTLPTNEWVHIVATYGTQSKLYINGVLKIEVDVNNPIADNSDEFKIGGAGGGGQFDGEIDDVYVYDRAISASEVVELFELD